MQKFQDNKEKKKQGLEIINVNDIVMDALHMSGFDKFLKIRK